MVDKFCWCGLSKESTFQRQIDENMSVSGKDGELESAGGLLTGKSCAGRRGVLVPIVLLEARELVRAEEG